MSGENAGSKGKIFIVAGEESGDHHGAELVSAICSRMPGLSFVGIGGEEMEKAGVEIVSASGKISVVGIVELLEKAPSLLKAYLKARRVITHTPLLASIFIDFPDFNLRLARVARKAGLPVFYYISPQVWAWRKGRIRAISRLVDRMLVILPFEEAFYREHGVEVDYVGHPLTERMRGFMKVGTAGPSWEPHHPVIGLMPGSRVREVSAMLPHLLEAAKIMKRELPAARFTLLLARGAGGKAALRLIRGAALDVEVKEGPDYQAMAGFNYLIVASGTATLEAGLLRIPMVIVYRGHLLSWLLTKPLIKVPHIGLPNLVAGERIVPELRQYKVTGERIAEAALKVLKHEEDYLSMRDALGRMAASLDGFGEAQKAAEIILSRLKRVG